MDSDSIRNDRISTDTESITQLVDMLSPETAISCAALEIETDEGTILVESDSGLSISLEGTENTEDSVHD